MSILNTTDIQIHFLTQRVKELEEKVLKRNKRTNTTRIQQMLLLKHCGLMDILLDFKIQKQQKAKLLSIILNADETNLEDDLSYIQNNNPILRSKKDIEFLIKTFEGVGLENQKKEILNTYKAVLEK